MILRVGIKAVLVYRKKVLLLRRSPDITRGDTWDIPGGIIEQDEKLLQGLRREVYEESGIKIKSVQVPLEIGYFNEGIYRYKNVIRIIYFCPVFISKVKLSPEHCDYKWFSVKDLRNLDSKEFISPKTYKILVDRIEEVMKRRLVNFRENISL